MCFSAEASFVAAGTLGLIGCATLKTAQTKAQIPLALIPLLFGIHQLTEGILWIYLGNQSSPDSLFYVAQTVYIIFAYLLFLVFMPLAVLALESVPSRRHILQGLLVCALGLALLNLDKLPGSQVVVKIVGHSIQYPFTDVARGTPYILVICAPFFVSSQPRVWVLGALGFIGVPIAMYFYYWTFASVWCFFAALISTVTFWILKGFKEQESLAIIQDKRIK